MAQGELTTWESSVMVQYWKMLRLVSSGDEYAVVPCDGVSIGELRKYLQHDLRTVKMRLEMRGCKGTAYDSVLQAWSLANEFMRSL